MMQIGERISLDLWEMIERICFDADMEHLMDARGEPDIEDSLSHGMEAGLERYSRHLFYFEKRQRYTVITIGIIAVACLEAYVNELIVLEPSLSEAQRNKVLKERLRDKYQSLSKLLSGKTFNTNNEPFDSFSLLVDLRNALVHFDPISGGKKVHLHPPKLNRLTSKIPDIHPRFAFPEGLITASFLSWVRDTVASMIRAINMIVEDPNISLNTDVQSHTVANTWEQNKPNKANAADS